MLSNKNINIWLHKNKIFYHVKMYTDFQYINHVTENILSINYKYMYM